MTFTIWFFFVIAPLLALAIAALGVSRFMAAAEREVVKERERVTELRNTHDSELRNYLVPELSELLRTRLHNYISPEVAAALDDYVSSPEVKAMFDEQARNTERTQKFWRQLASRTSIGAAISVALGMLAAALATFLVGHQ
jgi:hypothetical protein